MMELLFLDKENSASCKRISLSRLPKHGMVAVSTTPFHAQHLQLPHVKTIRFGDGEMECAWSQLCAHILLWTAAEIFIEIAKSSPNVPVGYLSTFGRFCKIPLPSIVVYDNGIYFALNLDANTQFGFAPWNDGYGQPCKLIYDKACCPAAGFTEMLPFYHVFDKLVDNRCLNGRGVASYLIGQGDPGNRIGRVGLGDVTMGFYHVRCFSSHSEMKSEERKWGCVNAHFSERNSEYQPELAFVPAQQGMAGINDNNLIKPSDQEEASCGYRILMQDNSRRSRSHARMMIFHEMGKSFKRTLDVLSKSYFECPEDKGGVLEKSLNSYAESAWDFALKKLDEMGRVDGNILMAASVERNKADKFFLEGVRSQ